jgi:hypothetical protein
VQSRNEKEIMYGRMRVEKGRKGTKMRDKKFLR